MSKILILGFGREGKSTYKHLRKSDPTGILTIADKNPDIVNDEIFNCGRDARPCVSTDPNVVFKLGDDYLQNLDEFDVIIKSPGISLKNFPELMNDERITSQTDLFLQEFHNQIIGVTGTKGKSTTTALIYHILKKQSDNVILVGNIGIPPFDLYEKIDESTKIVAELSSHQLQHVQVSPHVAVLLNIYQEHLDHYNTYEEYQQSKWNITRYQNDDDFFVFDADHELLNELWNYVGITRKTYTFSASKPQKQGCYIQNNWVYFNGEKFYDCSEPRYLKGEHNLLNIMAAINVCKICGVNDDIIRSGIADFKGLPHRLEYVGTYHGITFYNDSISTIPEATIAAVKSLKNVQTLILGGFDRGIEYSPLVDFLIQNPIKNIIFIGEAGQRISNLLINKILDNPQLQSNSLNFFDAKNYDEVVNLAFKITEKNHVCLLSPAASSYDMFTNFEHRGDCFKDRIMKK
ncbi:MAG: UDP-N-acetylmuramoyl-L-alanine--D-glutamate ligase [Bacteroidales bacterium]|jgi:UDP-N-acetylmuramoylalanine--D-glutamate ligase|nr:UDP-N-acetylmuramoyl-L-alanine--D-glutamate ligase [Bacteroidales bacterium]